jgi:hypothetical protein
MYRRFSLDKLICNGEDTERVPREHRYRFDIYCIYEEGVFHIERNNFNFKKQKKIQIGDRI